MVKNESLQQAVFYIAADGSDNNPGTCEQPFSSIGRAQEAVRAINKNMKSDIIVYVKGGRYYSDSTISFDERDSGTNGYYIRYMGVEGEEAVFLGGTRLTGWVPGGNGTYKVFIGKNSRVNTLIENGKCAVKARLPKSGYFTIDSKAEENERGQFYFKKEDIPAGLDYYGAQIFVWPGEADWNWFSETRPVRSIDWEKGILSLETPAAWKLDTGARYYIQGARGTLSQPGEFYMDEREGWLYYQPYGSDINESEIIIPACGRTVELKGSSPKTPVCNIVFENLTFIGSDFGTGYSMPDENNETEEGRQGLIYLENASGIAIRSCKILKAGYSGIMLNRFAQENTVQNCIIEGAGHNGIYLSGWAPGEGGFSSVDEAYVNRNNKISNNHIYDCGRLVGHGSGIQLYQSGDNEISHNEIHNMPRYGISMKGYPYNSMTKDAGQYYGTGVTYENHWDFLFCRNNRIEFNDIHHVLEDSQDAGGIEAWCTGTGNIIFNNCIHDITLKTPNGMVMGIYLDDLADFFTIRNNIVYNVGGGKWSSLVFLKGIYNEFVNNILYDDTHIHMNMFFQAYGDGRNDHLILMNNIIYRVKGEEVYRFWDWNSEKVSVSDFNVFYHPEGKYLFPGIPDGDHWEQWRSMEHGRYDRNSILADPMFEDAANRNFRLKPESPAIALGFADIDQEKIGLVKAL